MCVCVMEREIRRECVREIVCECVRERKRERMVVIRNCDVQGVNIFTCLVYGNEGESKSRPNISFKNKDVNPTARW